MSAAENLAAHCRTCRMTNKLEWMDTLAELLNAFYAETGSSERVETSGYGLSDITAVVGARIPKRFVIDTENLPEDPGGLLACNPKYLRKPDNVE